jgi:hypothetical protein
MPLVVFALVIFEIGYFFFFFFFFAWASLD